MTQNSAQAQNTQDQPRRFTLMLTGEDVLDEQDDNQARQGLPHERYLLGDQVPLAPILLLGQSTINFDPNLEIACLQPVHLHATRDHLILMGQNQIDLTETESTQLLNVALPLLQEDFEHQVLFHNQHYWFIPVGPFNKLASYSVDQAQGRNIDWWMPHDTHEQGIAKRWRKLQNEIQMLWHIDSVNEERQARGLPSINSIWISGIGRLRDVKVPLVFGQASKIVGQHPLLSGLAKFCGIQFSNSVSTASLDGAFAWLDKPEALWPQLVNQFLNKQLDEVMIIDFPEGRTRERVFTLHDIQKKSWMFWRKPEVLTWKDAIQS
ncbi:hypothetical protein [Polynucleobacter sp. MWH-UH25E]|uniref:hypothetical protein n=1 Tax=Polynucleobacter sp. MWH-UH25E TaxID=1855616 RepID=UPI0020405B77|nr:hypothetical protein [Polynucleobacter sp. MWH-UH25E]